MVIITGSLTVPACRRTDQCITVAIRNIAGRLLVHYLDDARSVHQHSPTIGPQRMGI
jgi:hypothetical protein